MLTFIVAKVIIVLMLVVLVSLIVDVFKHWKSDKKKSVSYLTFAVLLFLMMFFGGCFSTLIETKQQLDSRILSQSLM